MSTLANKPVVAQNMQRGNYRMFETVASLSNSMTIYPNLTHKDPRVEEMLGNVELPPARCRSASTSPEIVDIVYLGQSGSPGRSAPGPRIPGIREAGAAIHRQHNLAQANRRARPPRLRQTGSRSASGYARTASACSLSIDVITALYARQQPTLEADQVGIGRRSASTWAINAIDRSLYYTRGDNRQPR